MSPDGLEQVDNRGKQCIGDNRLYLRWISLVTKRGYMPVISMFYGFIVSMYYLDTKQHSLSHIPVKYGEMEGIYEIPDGNLLQGSLPSNKEKLIKAWIEIHKEELMADWQLAVTGNKVFNIDPLNS